MSQDAPKPCEVVIMTALPVEFQAVVAHLGGRQEVVHPQAGTVYQTGSCAGKEHPWRIAVAQIGMGGLSAASETTQANSFFHPHIMLFVGVAGGLKEVQLGDVVVAEKVYAYESGKAEAAFRPRPELWHASYALKERAKAEANEEAWLTHLGSDRPSSLPKVRLGALAAGEKVVASQRSSVYRFLQKTYGDALAVEMESHGFLQAMHAHQNVYAAVIRGISDLIDDKADADAAGWQEIAARHAAAFAFQVLSKFTLPKDLSRPVSLLNLPYQRNPFFTGREEELQQLQGQLWQDQSAVVGQQSAISGFGGIGKTQLAVEYAYRHHLEYRFVLWARADSAESLNASYTELAALLDLPEREEKEQEIIVQAVKRWLQRHQDWLLILDNVDAPELLAAFLPQTVGGHLLLTTRAADLSPYIASLTHPLVVDSFSDEQGALFLLHRSGLLALNATVDQAEEQTRRLALSIAHKLGGLPLALDQAGAYIGATRCGLAVYQQIYQQRRAQLLQERRSADHPEPVATTWNLSFERVEQQSPAAADLLRFCAFLAPDAIPEEILTKGADVLGETLVSVIADPFLFNQVIEQLRAYSLLTRDPQARTLSIHRLVQAVLQEAMSEEERRQWAERAIQAVGATLPQVEHGAWPAWERVVLHAQVCAKHIKDVGSSTREATKLLQQTGWYLIERARYKEAEALLEQAYGISERQQGSEHLDTARDASTLAHLYQEQGRYAEAEPLYQRVVSIFEQQLGAEHPSTATSLNNLAVLYESQGRYAEAEPLYRRALSIDEQAYGANHPDVAIDLNNLAMLYQTQGKYAEAEPLLKRALAIFEQSLGKAHPNTQIVQKNYAVLVEALKPQKAES